MYNSRVTLVIINFGQKSDQACANNAKMQEGETTVRIVHNRKTSIKPLIPTATASLRES
jgi:hypothetical protein